MTIEPEIYCCWKPATLRRVGLYVAYVCRTCSTWSGLCMDNDEASHCFRETPLPRIPRGLLPQRYRVPGDH